MPNLALPPTRRQPFVHLVDHRGIVRSVASPLADEGTRVVPIDKVVLGNRLKEAVKVILLPDVGSYELAGGDAEEFACGIVKGFALSADGTQYRAACGKRYAVTRGSHGLEIVELVLTDDRAN